MVKIKQKPAVPDLDWSGVDAVIEHEAHPQLAKRIEAFAGDAYGTLVAPGVNMIYARIEGETEATMVMVDPLANIAGLRANTPIKVYRDKELNNYVWDGKTSIGSYNQATGGATPPTLPQMAEYWLAVANAALPNAYVIDDVANGLLKHSDGVPAQAVASTDYVAPLTGTGVVNDTMLTGQVSQAHGGLGTDISASQTGRIIKTGANSASTIKDLFVGTAAPTTGDDSNDGYSVGSFWFDVTNDHVYVAIDVSVGGALWLPLDGSSVDWANPGTIGSSTPNTGAFTTLTATTGQFDPNSNNRTEILIGGVQETRAESSNLTQPTYHIMRRAGGSIASPSATQNTQVIARWEADSHSGSAYVTAGYLQFDATETHSGSVRGTKATIRTTQAGGTTARDTVFKDYGALNLPSLSGAPSSPADGDIWVQDHKIGARQEGITSYAAMGDYTQTDFVSNSSSSAENTYVGSSQGAPNYPANFFNVGTALVLEWSGILSLGGTSNTLTYRVKFGSVTIGTFSFTGSTNNIRFYVRLLMTCVATGASSTMRATGYMLVNATVVHSGTAGLFNVNTANAQQFSCTIQCSSATGTVSTDQACLTRLK